jgi:hypothetical protein
VILSKNIPILLIGYNRPDLLLKRVTEIVEMGPPTLYVSIDGGEISHQKYMLDVISKVRADDNLHTKIIITHHEENLGLTKHITSAISSVLAKHERVIIVEDDIVLSRNFYNNMISAFLTQDTLKLKGTVGAFSPISFRNNFAVKNKWRKTRYFSCWGWGCSREVWKEYKLDISKEDFVENLSHSQNWNKLSYFQKNLWLYRFNKIALTPEHTWDIQFQYMSFKHDFQQLLPMSRFVNNEGFFDQRAVHTKGQKPRWLANPTIHNSLIPVQKITYTSALFEFFLDSNTIAGDTKLIQYRNKKLTRK